MTGEKARTLKEAIIKMMMSNMSLSVKQENGKMNISSGCSQGFFSYAAAQVLSAGVLKPDDIRMSATLFAVGWETAKEASGNGNDWQTLIDLCIEIINQASFIMKEKEKRVKE